MENMYKSATVISIISFVLIVIYVVYAEANRTNLAYVELGEVFENFQMKKDLEKEIEKIKAENSNTLNKLIMEYNRIVQRIDSSGGNDTLRQHAYQLREQIDIFNNEIQTKEENTSAEYDNQIWSRINQYIYDFGKENNYSLIFGTAGNGNIMYADTSLNVTNQFVKYINKKYVE